MTLARHAQSTVTVVDEYCAQYQDLFPDVRSFEQFTYRHIGMLSERERKSLPTIAKAVGKTDGQALHHFPANAPWSVEAVRKRRLSLLKQALHERPFFSSSTRPVMRRTGTAPIMSRISPSAPSAS